MTDCPNLEHKAWKTVSSPKRRMMGTKIHNSISARDPGAVTVAGHESELPKSVVEFRHQPWEGVGKTDLGGSRGG